MPRQVAALVKEGGLDAIEWGGDVHVPHGDLARAKEVAAITADAGLQVAAYGSYYRAGAGNFEPIRDTALDLGAPLIRIWAGDAGSADVDDTRRKVIVNDVIHVSELSAATGVRVALEWHGGTLTDTLASAQALLAEASHPNLSTLWQPVPDRTQRECQEELSVMGGRISNLHVYHWTDGLERRPLEDGAGVWRNYFAAVPPDEDRFALLEFVRDDSPDAFLEDAGVLRNLLSAKDG